MLGEDELFFLRPFVLPMAHCPMSQFVKHAFFFQTHKHTYTTFRGTILKWVPDILAWPWAPLSLSYAALATYSSGLTHRIIPSLLDLSCFFLQDLEVRWPVTLFPKCLGTVALNLFAVPFTRNG